MQKTARKNTKCSRNETSLKIGHLGKDIAHAKATAFTKHLVGSKIKMPKTRKESFYKTIRVVLCKNPLETTPNIREMRQLGNRPSSKGYGTCKGYRLCKMVSLGQKLKMPKTCEKSFYKTIGVVQCKIPLEKTSNIAEMRQL